MVTLLEEPETPEAAARSRVYEPQAEVASRNVRLETAAAAVRLVIIREAAAAVLEGISGVGQGLEEPPPQAGGVEMQ